MEKEELAETYASGINLNTTKTPIPHLIEQAYLDGYQMGYQKAQEWISVEDRLPKQYETVLCYGRPIDEGFGITHCEHSDGIFRFCDSERENKSNITHWQPLPTPPKKETKKD